MTGDIIDHSVDIAANGAARLYTKALSLGWTARLDTVQQREWKSAHHDCTLLRVERGLSQGVGIWWDGKADVAYTWTPDRTGRIYADRIGINQFAAFLSVPDERVEE